MSVLATDGDGVQTLSSPLARHGASPLLRKGVPGEKKPLKEKLLTYYEQIFQVAVTTLITVLQARPLVRFSVYV